MYWKIAFLLFFLCLPNKEVFSAPPTQTTVSKGIEIKINDFSYQLSQKEIDKWKKVKTELYHDPTYYSEIENTSICSSYKLLLCNLTFTQEKRRQTKKISHFSANKELISQFIDDLARKANRDPEDAKFIMKDGRVTVFSLNKNGFELEKEAANEILISFLEKANFQFSSNQSLALPFKETSPEISIDSIDSMGIDTLIGEGKSDFRGSTRSRIHNIKVASSRFNGLLIKPGEEFSFVEHLGEVDAEHGYLPELVIKKDKTEPEFGGGICQVSTTAFRAAIYSGLEVTARRNHAYPVSYYNPQGMDATVYIPRPDLRFINDTSSYILIETQIEGTELTFLFYGSSDGRKIEIIGPKVTEKNSDGSMKTTFTQKVIAENGDLLREDVFNSNYDSPSKYPHPGETTTTLLTKKPSGWSDNEWKSYKKEHGI